MEVAKMCDKKNAYYYLLKLVLLASILVTVGAPSAWATRTIKTNFKTAYPSAIGSRLDTLPSAVNHCGVCHFTFNAGGDLNPYGEAIAANGSSSAEILAIGSLDSDGDGFTNDEEIKGTGFTNIPTFSGLTPSNVSQVTGVTPSELTGFLVPVAAAADCEEDADCDDGLFCTGIESCSSETSLCVAGTDPCTGDTPECIEEGTGTCVECVSDDGCAAEETCEDNVCTDPVCPPDTPPEVLAFDEDGDCLLNKVELKKYSDTLKVAQKAEQTALKTKHSLEKDKYKAIKINYSIK
jgi:hypothetical protein